MNKETKPLTQKWSEVYAEGKPHRILLFIVFLVWRYYLAPHRWKWIVAMFVPVVIILEISLFWGLLTAGFVLFSPVTK